MSKAIYIKDGNKLREIPDEGNFEKYPLPICFDQDEEQGQLFIRSMKIKDDCKEYPCPPQHSFVEGVAYEEGKDYEMVHYNHGGFGKPDDYKATAIPINKESEDDKGDFYFEHMEARLSHLLKRFGLKNVLATIDKLTKQKDELKNNQP